MKGWGVCGGIYGETWEKREKQSHVGLWGQMTNLRVFLGSLWAQRHVGSQPIGLTPNCCPSKGQLGPSLSIMLFGVTEVSPYSCKSSSLQGFKVCQSDYTKCTILKVHLVIKKKKQKKWYIYTFALPHSQMNTSH